MTFLNYLSQLVKFGISASIALGLVIVVLLLWSGGVSGDISFDLEFAAFDGFWFLLGLPAVTIVVLAMVSPLGFGVHRLLYRKRQAPVAENGQADSSSVR
jgi:hypothetical protein